MATNTGEINKVLLEEVFRIYQDAEYQMLKKVAKRVKRGITSEGWNEVKLKDVQALNKDIGKILKDTSSLTKGHLNKGLIKAYESGREGASLDFEKIKPGKIPDTFMKDLIPYHLQRMILESYNMVDRASIQILRNTMDVYREVISSTNTGVLAGYETRLQASQNALNEFANKGITGFVDKSGRKWELASYVEMATRTGNAHAAIQGHIDRQLELGNDLVIVSSHANTCPLCAPWGGKVLSIKGNNPKYASLESAKAAGLFHPNCKHTITAYFPFIDEPEGYEHDKGYNPEMYEATQKQRGNERMIRMWKRREAVALTDEEQFRAHNKVLQWQAIQREHVNEYGLRRKYSREGISNRVGDPNKVKAKIQVPNINIKKPKELKIEEPAKKIITKNRSMREIDDILNAQTLRYDLDTEKKLKENANIWKSKITEDEEESVKKYTSSMFREMNEHMRGINTGSSRVAELVENCTNALNKAETEEELIVRRGVSCTGFAGMLGERDLAKKLGDHGNVWMEQNLNNLVGRIGSDKGFLSTSPHKTGGFFRDIDLRIEVPKGAKAVYVDEISEFEGEKEIIIQKGYNYLITDVVKRSGEKYTVYMKLLLPEE